MVMDSRGIYNSLQKTGVNTKSKYYLEGVKAGSNIFSGWDKSSWKSDLTIQLESKEKFKPLNKPSGPDMYTVNAHGHIVDMTVAEYKELKYQESKINKRKISEETRELQKIQLVDKVVAQKSDYLKAQRFRRNFLKRAGMDSTGILERFRSFTIANVKDPKTGEIIEDRNKIYKDKIEEMANLIKDMKPEQFDRVYSENKEAFKDLSAYYKSARSNPLLLANTGKDFKVDSASGNYQNTLDDIIDKLRSVQ